MTRQLAERLRELAEDAPGTISSDGPWREGRRRQRRRLATPGEQPFRSRTGSTDRARGPRLVGSCSGRRWGGWAPRQRAVIVLRYFEDLTEVQTGEALGISVGTVKSQSRDALARLRAVVPDLDEHNVIRSEGYSPRNV
ncbi:MAG TPA: sigma factor-like helix-turn-helix DNA-binding protein [Nocardioides sp.]|uniref:sigma factor-like helix-turn-helix DNA-binding protein n=1 Tax=Nocardioides sp. TaxID=35761 RepID=UPI002E324503|nr:sigma factor-like helix-turn-helix DNA-binding protein [Nocardioides sp.]HEX3931538.1 sigma factor-like helix-turn-helix DNA-binding protein [Nocardioides sp.]